jgi:dihydrodipicolinate synthase/N-acetylneuraminate lyase
MGPRLRGIVVALVTPLHEDYRPDEAGLRRLIQHVRAGGVSGVFACGSTGEGPMLRDEDWAAVTRWTVEEAAGQIRVLAHATEVGTLRVIDRARRAADLGADAIAVAAPYYYPHAEAEILRFYEAVADASPLPVFVYNIPSRVKTALTLSQVLRLAQHPNIVGMKDSSGDAPFHLACIHQIRSDGGPFTILNGAESFLAASVMMGGDGGVLGVANVAPRLCVDLFAAADREDLAAVRELQPRVAAVRALFALPGVGLVGAVKRALEMMGICGSTTMPPFAPASAEADAAIRDILDRCGLLGA